MAHADVGHYAEKHPPGTTIDERIAKRIRAAARDGRISCGTAHTIARELQVSPQEVGKTIDVLEIRIHHCQLGLFGQQPPQGRLVTPADHIDPQLEQAIHEALVNGKLPCSAAWQLAEQFTVTRLAITSACEALNIKLSPCQLGTF